MKRLATALVLIPAVTGAVLLGPPWLFLAILTAVGLMAFHEYGALVEAHGIARPGPAGFAAGVVLMVVPEPAAVMVLLVLLALPLALGSADLAQVIARAAAFVFGVLYIFGAWRCAADLRSLNPHWLMFALVVSWVGDTGAYYVGRSLGRHKMAPRVSPGKSWEGAAGSVATALAAGGVYAHYLLPGATLPLALGLAAAGNIAGQLGDLCESAIKRGAGVKDSGSSLPGHGGWLDRIDSTLFAVPVVYWLLRAWGV